MDIELKEKEEEKKKEEERKARIAKKNYIKETEEAKHRAYTSFGKLVLNDEINNPIWSIGKGDRFCKAGVEFAVPFTPGPVYSASNEECYKFRYGQKWKIGKSKRTPLHAGEHFFYYDYPYSEKDDFSKLPKKWDRKVGCAVDLDAKIKYDYREAVPGPGRYDPSLFLTKPRQFTYIIGEKYKTLTLNLLTGTNDVVGPGKYDVEKSKNTSIHTDFPRWSLGKDKRKGLFNNTFTKNETYENYSCVGDQIRTHKRSEPKINIGKSTREKEKIRGVFPSTMSNIPTKVFIQLPKI